MINLVLGTMTFGESVFGNEIGEFVKKFMSYGYNEIDTAYVYNNGECERLLGNALREIHDTYKIATKVNPRITGRLDSEAAFLQINESLSRLQKDYADVVYLHFPDPKTNVDSVLYAITELKENGKVKELGLSNYPAWMVADICNKCDKEGWLKPTVYEGIYNPLTRKAEIELNACLYYYGLKFYAYNPLAGGLLSGRYLKYEESAQEGRFVNRPNYLNRYWRRCNFDAVEMLNNVCLKYGVSCVEATFRWMAYHSMLDEKRGDAIILGASKLEHLVQNMDAIKIGPLPDAIANVFEEIWEKTRGESPEYFTLFKGI